VRKQDLKSFLQRVGWSLNPQGYKDIIDSKKRQSIGYFFAILLFAIIIMSIAAIPLLAALPSNLGKEFDKFDRFNIKLNISMKEPVVLVPTHPFITIDTTNTTTELQQGTFLITKDYIYSKGLFGRINQQNISDYKDITDNKEQVNTLLFILTIIAIPSLLICIYALFMIKYMVIIILMWLIALVTTRIAKYDIKLGDLFNVVVHAATVMILLELIFLPLPIRHYLFPVNVFYGITVGLIPFGLFIAYVIIGLSKAKSKRV